MDLAVTRVTSPKKTIALGGTFKVRVTVQNVGNQDISNAQLRAFVAPIARPARLRPVSPITWVYVPVKGSMTKSLRAKITKRIAPGEYFVYAEAKVAQDVNADNNRLVAKRTLIVK